MNDANEDLIYYQAWSEVIAECCDEYALRWMVTASDHIIAACFRFPVDRLLNPANDVSFTCRR